MAIRVSVPAPAGYDSDIAENIRNTGGALDSVMALRSGNQRWSPSSCTIEAVARAVLRSHASG